MLEVENGLRTGIDESMLETGKFKWKVPASSILPRLSPRERCQRERG